MKHKLLTTLTAAAVALTMTAAAAETVKLDGYNGSQAPDQVSITNVTKTELVEKSELGYMDLNL